MAVSMNAQKRKNMKLQVLVKTGRLALREDGGLWNAYWAPLEDSMEGAIWLASIGIRFVERSDKRKKEFMALCQELFGDICEEVIGFRPDPNWPVLA
jgi:hypothetical protein